MAEQKALFKRWIGVQRLVYNKTVEYLKHYEGKTPHWMGLAKTILADLPDFFKEVPFQIKKIAVRDAVFALREGKKRVAQGKIEKFELKFKSRKEPMQSCFIPHSAIKQNGIYPRISGKGLHYSESLPEIIQDSRLVFHRGRYFLAISTQSPRSVAENQGRIVALDPGIRSFMSFFSGNSFGQIGRDDFHRLFRLALNADRLRSEIDRSKGRRKQRLRKAFNRIFNRMENLVEELHHKCALFLVKHFDVILLPTFEVQNMVKKLERKIRSKTVRNFLNLKHYAFKLFLKHKAFEYGKRVVDVNEAYTSKTNSFTGEIMNIGSRRSFIHEGIRVDRDINGARGILLRALADSPIVSNDMVHC